MNDIDMGGFSWSNIYMDTDAPFYGSLFGNGYTIENLTIYADNPNKRHGIVGVGFNAIFDDIKLKNCVLNIEGNNIEDSGILFGKLKYDVMDYMAPKLFTRPIQCSNIIATGCEVSVAAASRCYSSGFIGGFIELNFYANEHTEQKLTDLVNNCQAIGGKLKIAGDGIITSFGGGFGTIR
ncbi:hypothetical protein D3C79_825340 [compost metagenome]